jgi:hypothetical protein
MLELVRVSVYVLPAAVERLSVVTTPDGEFNVAAPEDAVAVFTELASPIAN